jgi:hypothetical protein
MPQSAFEQLGMSFVKVLRQSQRQVELTPFRQPLSPFHNTLRLGNSYYINYNV